MHMESCTPPGWQALGKKRPFFQGPDQRGGSGQDACVPNGGRESHILQPACTDRRGEEIDTTCRLIPIVFLRRPMSPQSFISRWRGDATWLRLQFNSLQLHLQHTTLYRSDFYALVVLAFPIPRQKLRSTSSYHILSAGVCIAS